MSTQAARSIRFTHSSPQQAFRLVELTPDLLELISSPNAPTYVSAPPTIWVDYHPRNKLTISAGVRLYLKSPATDDPSTTENNAAYVNLCTPTKTFRIRQVQSSNSVHIIKPSNGQSDVIPLIKRQQDDGDDTGIAPETVTAIAKCGSTLELQGLSNEESFAAAKSMLARILRVWDEGMIFENDDGDVDMDGSEDTELATKRSRLVKKAVIGDLPFADLQCEKAWIELCAFVPENYKSTTGERLAFRPSAAIKLGIWKRVLEGCILHSIDVEKQFLVRDLWKAVLGDQDDDEREITVSQSLFDAIVRRLAERTGENAVEGDSELKCLLCLSFLRTTLC